MVVCERERECDLMEFTEGLIFFYLIGDAGNVCVVYIKLVLVCTVINFSKIFPNRLRIFGSVKAIAR